MWLTDAAVLQSGINRRALLFGAVLPISQLQIKSALCAMGVGALQALSLAAMGSVVEGLLLLPLHVILAGHDMRAVEIQTDREVLARHFAACERWLQSFSAMQLAGAEQHFADCAAALGIETLAARLHTHKVYFF